MAQILGQTLFWHIPQPFTFVHGVWPPDLPPVLTSTLHIYVPPDILLKFHYLRPPLPMTASQLLHCLTLPPTHRKSSCGNPASQPANLLLWRPHHLVETDTQWRLLQTLPDRSCHLVDIVSNYTRAGLT